MRQPDRLGGRARTGEAYDEDLEGQRLQGQKAQELEKLTTRTSKAKGCKGRKCKVNESTETVFMAKSSELTDVGIVQITDPELQDNGVFVVGTIANTPTKVRMNADVADGNLPDLYRRLHKRVRKGCASGGALDSFTSTWLSIGAKSIFLKDEHDDSTLLVHLRKEPKCMRVPVSMVLPDHLSGVQRKADLVVVAESGLTKTFQTLTGDFSFDVSVDLMATKVALSLEEQPYSWIVSAIASVYWRIEGNALESIECLRHSIFYAPKNSRDIGLVSLANVLLSAQLYNEAIIVANQAYEISGNKFAIVPFTLANIYALKGDADRAATFYEESIQLQPDFSEAKTRLANLKCR